MTEYFKNVKQWLPTIPGSTGKVGSFLFFSEYQIRAVILELLQIAPEHFTEHQGNLNKLATFFAGDHNVPRSQRFKKMIVRKYKDSTIHHQLFKQYRGLFKIILDFVGFPYVLKIWGFQRLIKIPPSYFPVFIQNDRD